MSGITDELRGFMAGADGYELWCPHHKAELTKIADRIDAENVKLRELVADMWEGYYDPRCEECHLKDTPTCADCPICAREASVIDRMRELGIEAEECTTRQ